MSQQWGPQATGQPNFVPMARPSTPGGVWLLVLLSVPAGVMGFVYGMSGKPGAAVNVGLLMAVVGFVVGCSHKRKGLPWMGGASGCMLAFVVIVGAWSTLLGYSLGHALPVRGLARRSKQVPLGETRTIAERLRDAADPQAEIQHYVRVTESRLPGAVLGWTQDGLDRLVTAVPRGGVLVMGPPGSGKTSAVLIPSVVVAPGACVSSSVKADVMLATLAARRRVGTCWHFDPGGQEVTPEGVSPVRWSPLVGVRSWDSANVTARAMADAMRRRSETKDDHFIDRAQDWLAVMLYAAHVTGDRTISDVADWAATADSPDTVTEVGGALDGMDDDGGAQIAQRTLLSLTGTPDKERGSIVSTLVRMLKVYNMVGARRSGTDPNFDPETFVRSTDTLYITAAADMQDAYAPLLAGLLEQIRFATYSRHKVEEARIEPRRPHVTFVLDEADKTAPIPLPQIISEAGGQSLHLAVGLQSIGLAVDQWGRVAESFLTLFPAKVIFRGDFDTATVRALSDAAGKYDRHMESWAQSVSYVGPYSQQVVNWNPSYSVQREHVLNPGDITSIPEGNALVWIGPDWTLLAVGMHWKAGVWLSVSEYAQEHPALPLAQPKELPPDLTV